MLSASICSLPANCCNTSQKSLLDFIGAIILTRQIEPPRQRLVEMHLAAPAVAGGCYCVA
jgi:hypothetical protein